MKKSLLFSLLALAFVGSALELDAWGCRGGNCGSSCSTGSCSRRSCKSCTTPSCEGGSCAIATEEEVVVTTEEETSAPRYGRSADYSNGSSETITTAIEEQV